MREQVSHFSTPNLKLRLEVKIEITVMGDPDDLMIQGVRLLHPDMQPVELSETQFVTLFPTGQEILNNAFEEAASI